ncbi:MAG: hypothetical protein AAFP03_10840, partial [Cyanobacteria bacterium J06598_3]
ELQSGSQQEYKYFGQHHFDIDANHTMHSDDAADKVEDIAVPEAFRPRAYELVDEVFELFTEFSSALHSYSLERPVHQNLRQLAIVSERAVPERAVPERAVAGVKTPRLAKQTA